MNIPIHCEDGFTIIRPHRSRWTDFEIFMVKVTLFGIALLVGAAVALYWSVSTIQPMTPTPTVYVNGAPK